MPAGLEKLSQFDDAAPEEEPKTRKRQKAVEVPNPKSLEEMFGRPGLGDIPITLGADPKTQKHYPVSPFPLVDRKEAGKELREIHQVFMGAALTRPNPDDGSLVDFEQVADILTELLATKRMTKNEKGEEVPELDGNGNEIIDYPPIVSADVKITFMKFMLDFPDEQLELIAKIFHRALRRRTPDISIEKDILPELDMPTIVRGLRAIFCSNVGLMMDFLL